MYFAATASVAKTAQPQRLQVQPQVQPEVEEISLRGMCISVSPLSRCGLYYAKYSEADTALIIGTGEYTGEPSECREWATTPAEADVDEGRVRIVRFAEEGEHFSDLELAFPDHADPCHRYSCDRGPNF